MPTSWIVPLQKLKSLAIEYLRVGQAHDGKRPVRGRVLNQIRPQCIVVALSVVDLTVNLDVEVRLIRTHLDDEIHYEVATSSEYQLLKLMIDAHVLQQFAEG